MPRRKPSLGGYTLSDLLVVLFLISALLLLLLLAMPRGREQARLAACQKNLGQIGIALGLYNDRERVLPTVMRAGAVDGPGSDAAPGPLLVLLESFGLDSFQGLARTAPLPPAGGPVPGEVPVPGFVCASDPNATAGILTAPVSYRATTGGDRFGRTGAFAPGRALSLEDVEQTDGVSYTAGFSERLVGNGRDNDMTSSNYASASAPLPDEGCTRIWVRAQAGRWYGDAGKSWRSADYRSTLYNHALPPAYPVSCTASDGQSAYMVASSGHERGVNLLMLDGSVKLVQLTIAPPIWREFASLPDLGRDSKQPQAQSSSERR
jgi:prepilin-type processing-associated H-X9-DG protein